MPAVLRASGKGFDVDAFVATTTLKLVKVFRCGEAVLPLSKSEGRKCEESGITVDVSEADFDDLYAQVKHAIDFLGRHREEVIRLVSFPGVGRVALDFGVQWRDVYVQSECFPVELVRVAGACGIGLEITHYPVSKPDDDKVSGL